MLVVKNLPANAVDVTDECQSLGQEDTLEDSRATHFNVLPWRIPGTVESGRL